MTRNRFESKDKYFKCCIRCEKRYVGCHSDCEEYLNSKQQYETDKQNYIEKITEDNQIEGYEYGKRSAKKREEHRKRMQRK